MLCLLFKIESFQQPSDLGSLIPVMRKLRHKKFDFPMVAQLISVGTGTLIQRRSESRICLHNINKMRLSLFLILKGTQLNKERTCCKK